MNSKTTADVSADREDVAIDAAARESTEYSARLERGSGTAKVEEKRTGTERRTPVETTAAPASTQNQPRTKADELKAARDIATTSSENPRAPPKLSWMPALTADWSSARQSGT